MGRGPVTDAGGSWEEGPAAARLLAHTLLL